MTPLTDCLNLRLRFFVYILVFVSTSFITPQRLDLSTVHAATVSASLTRERAAMYRANSNAHRLRVTHAMLSLLSDDQFLREFPEFTELAKDKRSLVLTALHHDWPKGHLRLDHPVILQLSDAYGIDYRSLPANDPRLKELKSAINRLNEIDDANWERAIAKRIKGSTKAETNAKRKLFTDLIKTIDFHDVPAMRQREFGGQGGNLNRTLAGAKQWITDKGRTDLGLNEDQIKRMSKWAEYLETKFDYPAAVHSVDPDKVSKPRGFGKAAKALVAQATELDNYAKQRAWKNSLSAGLGRIGGAAKGVAARTVGAAGIIALLENGRERGFSDRLLTNLSGTTPLAPCTSTACVNFLQACAAKGLSLETCAQNDFFLRLPLHEQSKIRKDQDLDALLAPHGPGVHDLRCEAGTDGMRAIVTVVDEREEHTTEIEFDPQNRVNRLVMRGNEEPTLVIFTSGKPGALQYKDYVLNQISLKVKGEYRTLPPDQWRNENARVMPALSFDSKLKLAAIGRAQLATRTTMAYEGKATSADASADSTHQIAKCCRNVSCLRYFAERRQEWASGGSPPARHPAISSNSSPPRAD